MPLCKEIKRLLSLDLHSYWEVFYLDVMAAIFSILLSFPLAFVLNVIGVADPIDQFVIENIARPVEYNVIKYFAPVGLSEATYQWMTIGFLFLIELTIFHLLMCDIHRVRKQKQTLKMTTVAGKSTSLPQYFANESKEEKKDSLCKRVKNELKRLFRLDLNSCWEIFYLDVILIILSFLITFPIRALFQYFHLDKSFSHNVDAYITIPLETEIIRVIAPSGLDNSTYRMITGLTIIALEVLFFHSVMCIIYLSGRNKHSKSTEQASDLKEGSGCDKEKKVGTLEKVYKSVFSTSSSTFVQYASTEKLLENSLP